VPGERAPMRKFREVLRLRHALDVSERQIAITIGVSRSTVGEYLRRAAVIGITWPVPEGLDGAELTRRLFTPSTFDEKPARPLPDWSHVHKELKRRAVTLLLLWEEYRAEHVDGYGYSRFCDLYRDLCKTISSTMRQTHGAAEKLVVDFAGDTVPVFDAASGIGRRAHVFVAVLGAFNYTYAEARWSEGLADWIGAHVNAFSAIGGVPKAVVCDNLKAASQWPAAISPGSIARIRSWPSTTTRAILPTRPRRPRDKAKVEVAVQIVQRFVLARLRNCRFFSLHELNAAIHETVADLNAKIMRKLGVSRDEMFAEIDRPALKALPTAPYQHAEWKKVPGRARLSRPDRRSLLLCAVTPHPRATRGAYHRHHDRDPAPRAARQANHSAGPPVADESTAMTRLLALLAIGLALAVAVNAIATAVQAPGFEGRWGPFEKPRRNEAACGWIDDCRPI
jgi:transposase